MLKKYLNTKIKEIDEKEHTIRFIFSTDDEDRHGEIVDQKGWDFSEYMKNPVVLFSHDHYTPAVGQTIELAYNENGQSECVIKFAVEENEFAKTLFNLYKGKFMRAVSAGFRNTKYEVDEENDRLILKENTLYEISLVNVPANAMALAKSAGIDTDSFEKFLNKRKEIVLKDDDIKNIAKEISENISEKIKENGTVTQKVETPKKDGKKRLTKKQINSAVRKLLKQRSQIAFNK